MIERSDIVQVARSFIGTRFHHMGRSPGRGLDCAGVLICAGRALGVWPHDFDVPAYREHPDGVMMRQLCEQYLTTIRREAMQPGDAVLLIPDRVPQHVAIVGDYKHGGLSIIHASNSHSVRPPRVIETRLMFARNQKFVAAYAFPGVQ